MKAQILIAEIRTLLQTYLENKISGSELVQHYDSIVVQDEINWDFPDGKLDLIDKFQDELAFYVENPDLRKEHVSYYGDLELTQKVKDILIKLI